MKRILLFFTLLLNVYALNAQTFTFNMYESDNTKWRIDIDVSSKYITAKKGNSTLFSCSYYNHTINTSQQRIGLSLQSGTNPVTSPGGSSYFIISRGKGMAIRLTSGEEYNVKCDNANANASTYDQLAKALRPPLAYTSNHTFTANGVSFTMVYVQGGTFTMGATSEQGSDAESDEKPTHSVTLSSYMIGQTEVTQVLWQAVMGNNPSGFTGDSRRPVEKVSWDDCQEFIRKLNSLTGQRFRLPTEAEWEFAAKGGNKSNHYKYSGSNTLGNVAWYDDNSGSTTHPVGTKQSNELGIYDMSGNVWEWCNDWYGDYSSSSQTNPHGPSSGSSRVLRGGGCNCYARGCRVTFRSRSYPGYRYDDLGLRLSL